MNDTAYKYACNSQIVAVTSQQNKASNRHVTMLRASFVLLIAIAMLFSAATAQNQCPPNQEWTTCGSACPPSCNSPPNQACTLQCKIGCQCKQGYLLNSAGQCVPPSAC